MLARDEVAAALDYSPTTGIFTWKQRVALRVRIGDVAGSVGDKGYRVISFRNRDYKAHHLAWLLMTGEWPAEWIDHANGDRGDNRWCNLRLASPSGNARNAGVRRDNTSGFKGVSLKKATGRWSAALQVDGKRKALGYFDTPEEAAQAYARAAQHYYGEFARVA